MIKDKKFWIALLVVLAFYGVFLQTTYATDTYSNFIASRRQNAEWFLGLGRPLMSLASILIGNFSVNKIVLISTILAFVSLTISIYILDRVLSKKIKNQFLSFILAVTILIVPFEIELFIYEEKGIMLLGILFATIAIKFFNDYIADNARKNLLKTMLFAVMSIMCYQGVFGFFIVLSAALVLIESKNWKEFFKNTAIAVAVYAIASLLNFVVISTAKYNVRIDGNFNLIESFKTILPQFRSLFNLYGIIPSRIVYSVIAVVIVLTVAFICTNKTNKAQKIKVLLGVPYIFVVTVLAAIAPVVVQSPEKVWCVPRSTVVFTAILGIIALITTAVLKEYGNKKVYITIMLSGIIVFLAAQLYCFTNIEHNHFQMVALDKERALTIGEKIKKYEEENNTQIKTISVSPDKTIHFVYYGIIAVGDGNISAMSREWSDVNSISYWNERVFERIEASEENKKYCQEHEWEHFSEDQLIFNEDTLHICAF